MPRSRAASLPGLPGRSLIPGEQTFYFPLFAKKELGTLDFVVVIVVFVFWDFFFLVQLLKSNLFPEEEEKKLFTCCFILFITNNTHTATHTHTQKLKQPLCTPYKP